jgi:GTPase
MEENTTKMTEEKKEVTASVANELVSENQVEEHTDNPLENLENYSLLDEKEDTIEFFKSHVEWTIRQGHGEMIFEVGGKAGLSDEDCDKSVVNLIAIADKMNCDSTVVCERKGKTGKSTDVLIRERDAEKYSDIRIAVCGNVDAGKSTLVGVLTSGKLDDGRGSQRVACFNFKHEKESGRTSSIGEMMIGFNTKGVCVNYEQGHKMDIGNVMEQSYKVVSFFDLAGHERYLKTTVSGMTGNMPDYCFLLVGANMGVTRMTKEHLGIAIALKIPIIIVITKIDMCPENVKKQTLTDLYQILKVRGVRKMPIPIRNGEDIMTAIRTSSDRIAPIFEVSSVEGTNLDLLRKFLNLIPPRIQWDKLKNLPTEITIDQTWFVAGVGTVVGGTVMQGIVTAGQTLLLGPDSTGKFESVQIKSIHSKRTPVQSLSAGHSAGFALKKIKRSAIRKGMVLADAKSDPHSTWIFEADVAVLFHSTTITVNYQPVIQCMTIRQSAKIVEILEKEVLRTGDRAKVRFQFMFRPEFLKVGMRLIFREGRCKGIGVISAVTPSLPEDKDKKPASISTAKEERKNHTKDSGINEIKSTKTTSTKTNSTPTAKPSVAQIKTTPSTQTKPSATTSHAQQNKSTSTTTSTTKEQPKPKQQPTNQKNSKEIM